MAASNETRGWRNRPVDRERDGKRVLWLWGMWLGIVISLVPSGAYLMQQNECIKADYERNSLRRESERLVEIERRLRVDSASLGSLSSVEVWASSHNRLTLPGPEEVHVVNDGASGSGSLIAVTPTDNRD